MTFHCLLYTTLYLQEECKTVESTRVHSPQWCDCYFRQQGEAKRALEYANKAVQVEGRGKIQLLFRGSLYHSLGNDHQALEDFKVN